MRSAKTTRSNRYIFGSASLLRMILSCISAIHWIHIHETNMRISQIQKIKIIQKNKQSGCAQRLFDAINKAKGFEANILRTFGNENVS